MSTASRVESAPPSDRARQLVRKLEAWVQEEIGAKRRLEELLAQQEQAMSQPDATALETATREVSQAIQLETQRAGARHQIIGALAKEWSTSERALTLGGIAQRAGPEGVRLSRMRLELREVCQASLSRGRRIALVAQAQRSVLGEVLQSVVGAAPDGQLGSGCVVNREA